MTIRVCEVMFLFAVAVLYSSVSVSSSDVNTTENPLTGYGFELLSTKLDYMQYKLLEMDMEMKEDREEINQYQTSQKNDANGLLWTITQLNQALSHNLTALQALSSKILSQQTACASHELMRKELQLIVPKVGEPVATEKARLQFGVPGLASPIASYRSCKEVPSKRTHKYLIQPDANDAPFQAYCEQTRFGGGWLMIQHRYDGTLDFRRNWAEYREGFGSIDYEYWIGLERLHRLTTVRPNELLVELEDFDGNYVYARYTEFVIGNEAEHYELQKVGTYSGTAGDSLTYHKGMKYTTTDRDNDPNSENCATLYGAWWHNNCHYSNLNGLYLKGENAKAITWHSYKNAHIGMAYSRMMIREL